MIYDEAYRLLKKFVDKYPQISRKLDKKLKIAKINTSGKKYLAFIGLVWIILFVVAFLLTFFFGILLFGITLLFLPVYFILAFFIASSSAIFIYYYPDLIISDRKTKIENALPFITIYLSTIAKSGFPPQEMFRLLSNFKEYKTVAEEARKINSDIQVLGMDLPTALTRAIRRSPSASWTELLAGLRNSITVGGDLAEYLEEKAKGFLQQYQRKLREFSDTLSLLLNIYITAVIVGIIFFVVISSLIAAVGGISIELIKFVQYGLIFGGLPLATAIFILIVKSLSPWSSE